MYEQVTHLSYFRTLVADAENIPLFEAAASLAQDEYPDLELQQVLSDLDRLSLRLSERCRDVSTELKRLQVTLAFFYKELGFAGNINNYYDPDNSFIHKVLESRRGIPISLAVVFIELARNAGLDAVGVPFPGHFLVKVDMHEGSALLDPFTGQSLSQEDLHERLAPLRNSSGAEGEEPLPIARFLTAAPPRDILLRMLRNLQEIYRQHGQAEKLQCALDRQEILLS